MRILCLHGWRTSGSILREQMSDISAVLEAGIGPALCLHFPDAPHTASGPPQDVVQATWPGVPYFEWWDKVEDGSYSGADATLAFLCDIDRTHRVVLSRESLVSAREARLQVCAAQED